MEELLESTQSTNESRYVGLENMAESIEMKRKYDIEVQLREVEKQDAKEETLNEVDSSNDYNKVGTVNNPPLLEAKKNAEEVGNVKTGNFHRSFSVDGSMVIKKLSGWSIYVLVKIYSFRGKKGKCGSKQRPRRFNGKEVIQKEATKESSPKLMEALESKGGVDGEGDVNNEREINLCLTLANTLEGRKPLLDSKQRNKPETLQIRPCRPVFSAPLLSPPKVVPFRRSLEKSDINKLERFKVRTFVLGEGAGGGGGGGGCNGGGAQGGHGGVGVGN